MAYAVETAHRRFDTRDFSDCRRRELPASEIEGRWLDGQFGRVRRFGTCGVCASGAAPVRHRDREDQRKRERGGLAEIHEQ